MTTLEEARDQLRQELLDGHAAPCPLCTQTAKVYKRTIFSTMARHLLTIYRTHGTTWVHLPRVLGTNDGSAAKLAYWGLLEESTERRVDGGRKGWWRLTEAGVAFAQDRLRVPKYAHTYDGRVLKHDGDLVGIRDCLGEKFNYDELMGR